MQKKDETSNKVKISIGALDKTIETDDLEVMKQQNHI